MFPKIEHIDDVWPHVKDKSEFIRIDREYYTAIDYVIQTPDSFKTDIQRECRGIKFYPDGRIMARPFHKFFNLGERRPANEVDLSAPHYLQEKVDGSMIHPAVYDDGRLVFMTKKGHTDVAKLAESWFLGDPRYSSMMRAYMHEEGFTPIFEFTGPRNRIVLPYETYDLTLLAMRLTKYGDYVDFKTLQNISKDYDIPLARQVTTLNYHSGESLHECIAAMEGIEGFVLTFDSGEKLKIKTEEYVLMHRALDDLSSKKKITNLILEGFADDVKPLLMPDVLNELETYQADLMKWYDHIVVHIQEGVNAYGCFDTRKNWAINYVQCRVDPWLQSAVYSAMDGLDPKIAAVKSILKNLDKVPCKWRGE